MTYAGPRVGDWMQIYQAARFWPLHPRTEDIEITTIAWALSQICRYGGHTTRFYSVAQHSVMVSLNCSPENALYGLLHDAAEALLGSDIPAPLKQYLSEYKQIENSIMQIVCLKFSLPLLEPAQVKQIDLAILTNEKKAFMHQGLVWDLPDPDGVKVFEWASWGPRKAYIEFMARFHNLTGQMNIKWSDLDLIVKIARKRKISE